SMATTVAPLTAKMSSRRVLLRSPARARRMTWCRTIRGVVPWLIGLFMVAQLAGVVPSEYVHPTSGLAHAAAHEHDGTPSHTHHHDGTKQDGAVADQCCALHSLAGVVPLVMMAILSDLIGERLSVEPTDRVSGRGPGRLDRPPRSLPSFWV